MKTSFRLATLALGLCIALPSLAPSSHAAPKNSRRTKAPGSAKVAPKKVASKAATINWLTNYNAALAQAKRLNKPMFIDFSTEWCEGCKILETTTFRDPKFIATSRNWVMVMINPEKSDANAKLERLYRVKVYPTLVFADSQGKIINQVEGSYPASMLLPKMSAAVQQLKSERLTASR